MNKINYAYFFFFFPPPSLNVFYTNRYCCKYFAMVCAFRIFYSDTHITSPSNCLHLQKTELYLYGPSVAHKDVAAINQRNRDITERRESHM